MTALHFRDFPLSEELLKALSQLQYHKPTKVQLEVMPHAFEKKDLVVQSQTGSGKTAAFAIPTCEFVDWSENKPQVLVLTPTRELAIQVQEDYFHIGRFKRIKVVALYGKASFAHQEKALKQKTHVVVGTPGRLIDHLQRGTLDVSQVKYLVLDEADEMLNMGFIEEMEEIMEALPKERITMLFSATMPEHIQKLCQNYMKEPSFIKMQTESVATDKVEQSLYRVKEEDKLKVFKDLTVVENPDSAIVFCNTKVQVDEVEDELVQAGYPIVKLHGGMEQEERLRAIKDFKKGYYRYLIATDVAARGIDISGITHVFNYDVPQDAENYIHRIGRTGRASSRGKALTLATANDRNFVRNIERLMERKIEVLQNPTEEHIEEKREDFEEKIKTRKEAVAEKGAVFHDEIMKLHINAGKKTKMRPVDVVGTICNLPGMCADDIGIINILPVSTFVEILNHKGDHVLKLLQTTPIKGRIRKVTQTER